MTGTTVFGIQMSTASVSFMVSSTMSLVLFRSTKGLNSPYRRIIFGLSCSDIFQSLSCILGPFAIPKGTVASIAPWAAGNRATCAANGFVFSNAVNFVGMYTCFLCIYYVCKLNWRMSDEMFRARIEWVLHLLVFVVNLPLTITALAMDNYHATSWGFCYYYHQDYLECGSGTYSQGDCDFKYDDTIWKSFAVIGGIIIPAITYLVILCCAVLLSRHAILKRREIKLNAATGEAKSDEVTKNTINMDLLNNTRPVVTASRPLRKMRKTESSIKRETKVQVLSRLYRRVTLTQALLFVVFFTIIYILAPYTALIAALTLEPSVYFKFKGVIEITAGFIFPLGGLFNILVYCRPKVIALRSREDMQGKAVSWIRGFAMVVAAGGEVPRQNGEMNLLRSEFTEVDHPTPAPSQLHLGGGLEQQGDVQEWNGWDVRDGMEWLFGDYYIEEESLVEIMYSKKFRPENISSLSMDEE